MKKTGIIILYLSIWLTMLVSQEFNTALGLCRLEIYGGDVVNTVDIQELIHSEADKLVEEFGKVSVRPFDVFMPRTRKEFYKLAKSAPEWGIAVALKRQNRIVIQAPSVSKISYNRLEEVIIHEINHLYLHRLSGHNSVPSWFMEGMAMRSSGEFSLLHKIAISRSLWQKNLIPLPGLYNFGTKPKALIKLAYGQAAAAVNALEYYYGNQFINDQLNLLKQGDDFWTSFTKLTGQDEIDFQVNYENYLANQFRWMFLLKTRNLAFILLPVILVIGFWLKRKRSNKILKKWEIEEALEDLDNTEEDSNLPS